MDVRLPDGTIVRNVPEGTTRAQLMARVSRASPSTQRDTALGGLDALGRGFADMASFGTADKIAAAGNALLPIDRLTGRKVSSVWDGKSFGDAFRQNLKGEQAIDAADTRVNPNLRLAGQVAGGVLGPVPGRALIAKGAARLKRAPQLARIVGESAVQSGLYGAGRGDSTSVTERLSNAGNDAVMGTAGALAGAGLVRGVARGISPVVDKSVKRLANAGVTMTPGQRGGRIARFAEQASESIPIIREPIKAAKARGVEQFNRAWINEALADIGEKLPEKAGVGRSAIEFAQEAEGRAFDRALSKIAALPDEPFSQGLTATGEKAAQLPPNLATAFSYTMNNEIAPLLTGKQAIDGETLQRVHRLLQKRAAGADKAADGMGDMLGDAYREVRDHFMGLAQRQAGDGAAEFAKANAASAKLQRVYDAASRPQSVDGVFTPSTAASAASRKGFGTSTRNLARGEARMQSLADAAKAVLPDTLPNSGTADRAAWITGLGALGSGGAGVAVSPALALPAAGLAQYIPGFDAILQKAALRGQGDTATRLADEIRKRAYIGGMFGAPAALQIGD